MRIRTPRKSTIMDKQYRVFVHRDFVKAMGLIGGGEIEWFLTQEGEVCFAKAKRKKMQFRPTNQSKTKKSDSNRIRVRTKASVLQRGESDGGKETRQLWLTKS